MLENGSGNCRGDAIFNAVAQQLAGLFMLDDDPQHIVSRNDVDSFVAV